LAAMTVTDFLDVPIWAMEKNDPVKTQFAYKRVGLPSSQRFVAPNGRSTARAIPLTSGSIAGRASVQMTMVWWLGLCGVSLLNVAVWLVAASVDLPPTHYRFWQLVLSGVYVAGCAFRSLFPRVDLERTCLWDTPLSAIFAGRFVATLAEICFAVQCTLFLSKLSQMTGFGSAETLSVWVVPLIVVAQVSCWYAVLTLDHRGHVVEELLWTVAFAVMAAAFAGCWVYSDGFLKVIIATGIACCAGAALLISVVDVPMYISRWYRNRRAEHKYLALYRGFKDTLARRHSTNSWLVWRCEVPWMTLYFSVGVWLSIGMVFLEQMPR
jgi:hypothetical protein